MSEPDFVRIDAVATEAIKIAEKGVGLIRFGAVNWADLRVVDIVSCQSRDGDRWIEVKIEEASPDACLGPWVRQRLAAAFPGQRIDVLTEW